MKLSFHGGAGEVTGACYLVETGETKILIDCGLFQGSRECAELNYENFSFSPREIDALIVTHAHLDHVGRIPRLIKEGFNGKIFSTAPTRDLAELILQDALHLSTREQRNLYEEWDLEKTLSLWQDIIYGEELEISGVRFKLHNAGHILGSAFVEMSAEKKHFLFSGDLGNVPSLLLPPPDTFRDIEYLIIESTYGNRTHETAEERVLKLERAVEDVASRGGTLMLPTFATERTQDILHLLNEMLLFKRIPEMPVFVDAPLAIKVTEVFEKYPEFYKEEIQKLCQEHPHLFRFKKLRFTSAVEESKGINDVNPPKIILAGSGMMNGGRILHHARRYLKDPKSILLVIGYQASGSLGRRLLDGEKMVKIFGEEIFVEAEIRKINGFSAHADNPQLMNFIESNRDALKRVFVVQGEEAQAMHLSGEIKDRLGVSADVPRLHESFEL